MTDRYLWRSQRQALDRLLSDRWRHDPVDAAIDPAGAWQPVRCALPSRLSLGHGTGRRIECDDLREGCVHLRTASRDGWPQPYDLHDDR